MTNSNTNPDYYKDELYLDEDFRILAKTYPADVSAIGVTTLIDFVEALEAEIDRLTAELAAQKEANHALDQINRDQKTACDHLDEVLEELAEAQRYIKALEANASKSVLKRLDAMLKEEE